MFPYKLHIVGLVMVVNLMLDTGCLFVRFQLGEPPVSSPGLPSCNPHGGPLIYGDCWYNCTLDDISGEDKHHRLREVLLCIYKYVFFSLSYD